MTSIPRRTSEFQTGSARKSSRVSKIPTSGSTSRASNVRPTSRITATPMRSSMRTPARTPNYRSSSRETVVPMTAEKVKAPVDDKEVIHAKTAQILNALSRGTEMFNELIQKGLRHMTHKQFIMILDFFLKPIVGSLPKDFHATYVDYVYNLLQTLECPYSINKSSLKTPNAPHCLNSIIILIAWLADFSSDDVESIYYISTDEITDEAGIRNLMDHMAGAFAFWNKEQEQEEKQIKEEIKKSLYSKHLAPGVDISADINRLGNDIEQLKRDTKPLSLMKELEEKSEESAKLNKKIDAYKDTLKDLKAKIIRTKAELEVKHKSEENANRELKMLEKQMSSQLLSVEQRHDLLVEIAQMKSALSSKRDAILELNEASSENEIQLSNLISKKFQLIERLNNLIYKLSSDLDIVGVGLKGNFDPSVYELKPIKDDDEFNEMLENLHHGLTELKSCYNSTAGILKDQLMKLEAEYHTLETKNNYVVTKLELQRDMLNQAISEESTRRSELTARMHNLQTVYHDHTEQIKNADKEIEERRTGIMELEKSTNELKEKKSAFMSRSTKEYKLLYEERKKEIEDRRKFLTESIAMMDEYEKTKPALPENLQLLMNRLEEKHSKKRLEQEENNFKES